MPMTSEQARKFWDDPVKSAPAREKLRLLHMGDKNPMKRASARKKVSKALMGRQVWNKGGSNVKIRGSRHYNWKGGSFVGSDGYRRILSPDHPSKDGAGYVMEHRLVMEKKMGRYLEPGEQVHHIDHNRLNNSPENLMLLSASSHHRLEMKLRWQDPEYRESMTKPYRKFPSGFKHTKEAREKMSKSRFKYLSTL